MMVVAYTAMNLVANAAIQLRTRAIRSLGALEEIVGSSSSSSAAVSEIQTYPFKPRMTSTPQGNV